MLCTVAVLQLLICSEFTDKFAFWHNEYAPACADAIARDRPLFIVFCGAESAYGRSAKGGLFVSESIERTLRDDYVRLHVDMATDLGRTLARRFQIHAEPSIVILDRSVKWTMFERAGNIAETDLRDTLVKFRHSKLGGNGKPVREVARANRPGGTAPAGSAATADAVRPSNYRVPLIRHIEESAFEREVIDQSRERTIIVDFWAEWCGPCRALGSLLERHIRERDGEFILVKINVDHAPNLTARYRVESIPAVKVFRDGKPVLEFVGLQSDADLRQTLDRLRPAVPQQVGSRNNESDASGAVLR
jgi:thioredoxin